MSASVSLSAEGRALIERLTSGPAATEATALDARSLAANLGLASEYLAGRLLAQLDEDGDRPRALPGVNEHLALGDVAWLGIAPGPIAAPVPRRPLTQRSPRG